MRRRNMILTMLCLAAIDPSRAFAGDRFVALKAEYETKVKQREAEYEAAYEAAEKKGVEALKATSHTRVPCIRAVLSGSPKKIRTAPTRSRRSRWL
jgi:hypothetical protein